MTLTPEEKAEVVVSLHHALYNARVLRDDAQRRLDKLRSYLAVETFVPYKQDLEAGIAKDTRSVAYNNMRATLLTSALEKMQ